MDYMSGGSLDDIIENCYQLFTDEFIKYTIWCVAKGIQALHDKNILHRDIKSDNVLCNSQGDIKIADLGTSKFLDDQEMYRKTQIGTLNFKSPEIIEGIVYSKEVDIWSFGCFIHELATGKPPFKNLPENESVLDAIINREIPDVQTKTEAFNQLMQRCFEKDPNNRIKIKEILDHPFLADAENCK